MRGQEPHTRRLPHAIDSEVAIPVCVQKSTESHTFSGCANDPEASQVPISPSRTHVALRLAQPSEDCDGWQLIGLRDVGPAPQTKESKPEMIWNLLNSMPAFAMAACIDPPPLFAKGSRRRFLRGVSGVPSVAILYFLSGKKLDPILDPPCTDS